MDAPGRGCRWYQVGQSILDVACGTGILAREAATIVGPDGSVRGLDMTPGMLEVARRNAPAIVWQHGTADALPFPDAAFDGVVSQFGMMFFPDRMAAFGEMLRVLVPGGRIAVAVWDSLENNPAFAEEVELLERMAAREAGNALRAPFSLGNRDTLVADADHAGVSGININTHEGTASFPDIRTLVEADLRGWLPVMGVNLDEAMIQAILEAAESALEHHVDDQGTLSFRISAHILDGAK